MAATQACAVLALSPTRAEHRRQVSMLVDLLLDSAELPLDGRLSPVRLPEHLQNKALALQDSVCRPAGRLVL